MNTEPYLNEIEGLLDAAEVAVYALRKRMGDPVTAVDGAVTPAVDLFRLDVKYMANWTFKARESFAKMQDAAQGKAAA